MRVGGMLQAPGGNASPCRKFCLVTSARVPLRGWNATHGARRDRNSNGPNLPLRYPSGALQVEPLRTGPECAAISAPLFAFCLGHEVRIVDALLVRALKRLHAFDLVL